MINIDKYLKSVSPTDVYTYSFTRAQVDHINRALQRYDLINEIRHLIFDDIIKGLIEKMNALPFDYEKNWQGRRYVILEDVIKVLEEELKE